MRQAKSSFSEALEKESDKRPGQVCSTCKLPAELLAQIHAAHQSGASLGRIARALNKSGTVIKEGTLAGHFRKGHHEQA